MRIFYASPSTPHDTQIPQSKIWYQNLCLPLQDLGHELIEFDFDYSASIIHVDPEIPSHQKFIQLNRPKLSEELIKQVKSAHAEKPIDLFFSYFYSAYVDPEAIRIISKMGIVTINWYCNASYQLHLVEEIAPAYDYCLVPEKFRLEDYRRIGANPIYCQEAANPNIYKPYSVPVEFDITFVGQRYGNRPSNICTLLDAGMDVRVWGPYWRESLWRRTVKKIKYAFFGNSPFVVPLKYCGAPLTDEEYVQMYSRSKISLGFTTVGDLPTSSGQPIKQVRLRDFEAPMSGAFYLVEYFEELTEFFEPDKEVVYFHDSYDLIEKARYYLEHEEERECIRIAGMKRARNEHTWHQRFQTVFQQIGLK